MENYALSDNKCFESKKFHYDDYFLISNNFNENTNIGLYALNSSELSISNNYFANNSKAIKISECNDSTIYQNTIAGKYMM